MMRSKKDKLRLQALREAVHLGAADADAGRIESFDSSIELWQHVTALTNAALRKLDSEPAVNPR